MSDLVHCFFQALVCGDPFNFVCFDTNECTVTDGGRTVTTIRRVGAPPPLPCPFPPFREFSLMTLMALLSNLCLPPVPYDRR